jgi:S-adenosylmethionine-diacylglycerol 3-amino-3-carboxypropyl transferase
MSGVAELASFDIVRYANCWEDAEVLVDALAPHARGGRVLSIASAGDNVLALLTQKPELVVAVDLSAPQLACLELRIAGFRTLEYSELLAFLGLAESANRFATYRLLRRSLSNESRAFLDQHRPLIEKGIIHHGKFERYFRLFRQLLPLIHGGKRVAQLLEAKSVEQRQQFFDEQWNTWAWRMAAKVFFSRRIIGCLGRDPSFFEHVDGPVADRVLKRAEYALTALDTSTNPYLRYILTGNFGESLPLYLRRERFQEIRDGLDRVHLVQGDLESVSARRFGTFDAFNLSDIFEYMDESTFAACAGWLAETASEGAALVYWNMLVPRSLSSILPQAFVNDGERSRELHRRDKAFFYDALLLDRRRVL